MGIGGVLLAAAWSVGLSLVDATSHRLPNPFTVPAAVCALIACALHPQLAWGLVWPAGYLLLGRGIGGGDIKLAAPLGVAVCAFAGLLGVLAAVALAGLLTAAAGLMMRVPRVAHGPAMIAAAWIVPALWHLWA